MNKISILSILLFSLLSLGSFSQSAGEYYDGQHIRYDDYVYVENLKSVQLTRPGFEQSAPFIELNSTGQLLLRFDDLSNQGLTYYYTFIQCNSDWTPSSLMPMEYIDGMSEDFFNSSFQSFNTTIHYTHYTAMIPSDNMKLTKSGNYILKVYPEGEPDNPVITRRFYVYENKVGIDIEYFPARTPKDQYTKQELFIKVNPNGYPMPNVYEDLTMIVQQNGRKDNMLVRKKPKMITGEYLYYNLIGDIVFNGGNEFRVFDIRSLKTQSARINTITYDSAGYQVDLLMDFSRYGKNYLAYQELNGRYQVIEWDNTQFSDQVEADYAYVNFHFKLDSVLENGGIYLLGELTNWRMDEYSRLAYNPLYGEYTTTLLLKQGYYNYQYIYVPNGSQRGYVEPFEGNHVETGNTYVVYVYYRDQGQIYDRLIGLSFINTSDGN
jgi:hypothetical protein